MHNTKIIVTAVLSTIILGYATLLAFMQYNWHHSGNSFGITIQLLLCWLSGLTIRIFKPLRILIPLLVFTDCLIIYYVLPAFHLNHIMDKDVHLSLRPQHYLMISTLLIVVFDWVLRFVASKKSNG